MKIIKHEAGESTLCSKYFDFTLKHSYSNDLRLDPCSWLKLKK